MKTTPYLFLIVLILVVTPTVAYSQQGRADDKHQISTLDRKRNAALFVEANKEKNAGDLKKAEILYQKCIELDPQDAASMYELARIHILNNKLKDAQKMALQATEIDSTNTWYKLLLSNIYKIDKAYANSVEVLEDLVQQNPENLEFNKELAYNYVMVGENEKAIKLLNVIEGKLGVNEQISMQKQKLYSNLKMADSAVIEIEKLIKEFPLEARYYALLAELSLQNKLDDKALWAYTKIVELDPENAYIHISLSDFHRKAGNNSKALEELKLGFLNDQLDLDSKIQIMLSYYTPEQIFEENNPEAFELISLLAEKYPENTRILAIKSEVLYQARDFENALEILSKVVKIDSNLFASWEQLLITESALSKFESLREHSQKVIRLFPRRPIAYLFAGMVDSQEEKQSEALEYFKKGIKLVVNNAALSVQFYSFLGNTYHELKDYAASDQAYESALKLDPENAMILNNYAYYLSLRSEKLDLAKQMSFKAVQLDPENVSNIDTKAWVLYKLKNFEEAKIVIEKAMAQDDESSAEVFEHYGDILFQLGDKKKAVKYWKKARKKGSESEWLDKKIRNKKLYETNN